MRERESQLAGLEAKSGYSFREFSESWSNSRFSVSCPESDARAGRGIPSISGPGAGVPFLNMNRLFSSVEKTIPVKFMRRIQDRVLQSTPFSVFLTFFLSSVFVQSTQDVWLLYGFCADAAR